MITPTCPLPPEGWYCTREAGHPGPCAAWPQAPAAPVAQPADAERLARLLQSFADRLCNDTAAGTKYEGDESALREAISFLRYEAKRATPAAPLAQQSEPVAIFQVQLRNLNSDAWRDATPHEYAEKQSDDRYNVRTLYAGSAPASPVPSEWQDVYTAPKDEYVLCAAEFDGPGDWRIKMGCKSANGKWTILGGSWTPTRWRPLPAGPGAAPASTGPCSDDTAKDAARYRYIATLRDWREIEAMCWSTSADNAAEFKAGLDKFIDAALSAAEQGGKA